MNFGDKSAFSPERSNFNSAVFILVDMDISHFSLIDFTLVGSMFLPLATKAHSMSTMMSVALVLAAAGGALSITTYAGAPVSDRFAGWDVAFMGGIGAVALGGLGVLLSAMTN